MIALCLISLIIGLYFLRNNIAISIIVLTIFVGFVIYRVRNKKVILILTFFAIGLSLPLIPISNNREDFTYQGMVVECKDNYYLFQSGFEKFYVYEKGHSREFGDFLIIVSEPSPLKLTEYESQFSFKEYLDEKGVSRSLSSYKVKETFENPLRVREYRSKFLDNFDGETRLLIDAFLFCNKSHDSQVISIANELEIIFLLSMSGIYLHFFVNILEKLLSLFLKEKWAESISIIFVLPLLIFTFPKVGIIRVVLTLIIRFINKHFWKRRFSQISLVSALAFFLLIFDYHLAYQSSFYIGFLLSFLSLFINLGLSSIKKKKRRFIYPVLVYIFLLPISHLSNGLFHIFTLPFQLLLMPVNEVYSFTCLISFYIYYPFKNVLTFFSSCLLSIYSLIYKIDLSLPIADYFTYFIPMYYFGYFYLLYLIESRRFIHLKFTSIPLVFPLLISFLPIRVFLINAIYFINVGQGDSLIIQNKNNIVMIDTGGNTSFDMAKETLIPFMRKKQIDHIDALITTHNDKDHSGAVTSLIGNFTVKNYLNRSEDFPYKVGDIYLENLNNYKGSDENDNSLVFNLSFMGKKWLLMGDASKEVEKFLIDNNYDIDCDVLKVGHHGSKTSTAEKFIKTVTPNEAIISVGASNSYGHPSEETLTILNKYNVKIRRTDLEGTISFVQFLA